MRQHIFRILIAAVLTAALTVPGFAAERETVEEKDGEEFVSVAMSTIKTPVSNGQGTVIERDPDALSGKTISILGDSISTFRNFSNRQGSRWSNTTIGRGRSWGYYSDLKVKLDLSDTWWMQLADDLGLRVLVNNSWSGTRVVHEVKTGRETGKSIGAGFVDRSYNFVDPDIILIHGGTNDRNQSTPVGSYDWDLPVGQLDVSCYRSAYIALIKMLQARYEGVQIILIIGDRLTPDYESSTKAIAEHFGLPYVNFVGDTIDKCKGSHPNAPAFDKMAAKIYETCKNYLP